MLISFAIWLQNLPLFESIRISTGYGVLLTLHLIFISACAAMILATDLRLLGWGMRSYTIADLVDQLRVPKRIGFILVATCGILLLGSKAEEYYYNPFVRVKFTLFALVAVHALVFRGSVYSKAAEFDRLKSVPGRAKLAAGLSLFLWISIACMGRAIGYVSPANSPHHYAALFQAGMETAFGR
jgi:hypothetical protein